MGINKTMCVFILLLSLSFAYNASSYLTFDHNEVDITHACSYYNLTSPTAIITANGVNALGINGWNVVKGSLKTSYWEKLVKNVAYNNTIWQANVTCNNITDANSTVIQNCTDNGKYVTQALYQDQWQSLDTSSVTVSMATPLKVRFCGNYILKNGQVAIDHTPQFMGYVYNGQNGTPDYQWWNASFSGNRLITNTFTGTYPYYTSYVLLNSSVNISANCSDVRAIAIDNATAYPEFTEFCHSNLSGFFPSADGNDTLVIINVTDGAASWELYYGNPTAANASNWSSVLLMFHDAEAGVLDTNSSTLAGVQTNNSRFGSYYYWMNDTSATSIPRLIWYVNDQNSYTGKGINLMWFGKQITNAHYGLHECGAFTTDSGTNDCGNYAQGFFNEIIGPDGSPANNYRYHNGAGFQAHPTDTNVYTGAWSLFRIKLFQNRTQDDYVNETLIGGTLTSYNAANWTAIRFNVGAYSTTTDKAYIDNVQMWVGVNGTLTTTIGTEQNYSAPVNTLSVSLNSPTNGTNTTSTTPTLQYTVNTSFSSVLCNVTVDGTNAATNKNTTNNTLTSQVTGALGEGTHYWNVTCSDAANTTNNVSATWAFKVYTAAPTVTLNSPANGSSTNTSQVFNFTVTSHLDPTVSCSLLLDGAVNASNASVSNNTATTFTVTGISLGTHQWSVNCTNAGPLMGNSSNNSILIYSTPTVTLNSPANRTNTTSTAINFNWTVAGGYGGYLSNLTIDGSLNATNIPTTNNTATNYSVSGLAGGRHTWSVSAWNQTVGTGTSVTNNFTIYTTAPTVTLNSPAVNHHSTSTTQTFVFTATDSLDTSFSCDLYLNGVVNATNASVSNNTATSFTVTNIPLNPDPLIPYTWSVNCTNIGGLSYMPATRNLVIYANPTITLINPINGGYYKNPVTYNVTCYGAYATYNSLWVRDTTDLGWLVISGGFDNNTQFNGTYNFPSDGIKTIDYECAKDFATTTGSITVTADSTPPSITLDSPTNNSVLFNPVNIDMKWTPTDATSPTLATCTTYLDGVAQDTWYNTTSGVQLTDTEVAPAAGIHYWNGTCTDQAGNTNTSLTNTLIIAGLSITANSPANNSVLSGTFTTFNYSFTIAPSTNLTCVINMNGTAVSNITEVDLGTISRAITVPASAGTHSWNATCYSVTNTSMSVSTPMYFFTMGGGNYSSVINISTGPQNVLTTPQTLFYDTNGNLNALYFEGTLPTNTLHIVTVTNGAVNTSYSTTLNATDSFFAVFRESSHTSILTFSKANTTEYFLDFNGALVANSSASVYNVSGNQLYDPYSYAYTKQFTTLNYNNSGYYLFQLPTANGDFLMKKSLGAETFSSINSSSLLFGWPTLANSSDLTTWYYVWPVNNSGTYSPTLVYYNGSAQQSIQAITTGLSASAIANMSVAMEQYGGMTYVLLANIINKTFVYNIENNLTYQINETMSQPSSLLFVDANTFVFFSTNGTDTLAHSCYVDTVNTTSMACTEFTSAQYGAVVPYSTGTMITSKRNGTGDFVTQGIIVSGPVVQLSYSQNIYDVKYVCYDEINGTRIPFVTQIYSGNYSVVLQNDSWGYVIPSALLLGVNDSVFFLCQYGVTRELFSGLTNGYSLNFYSLDTGLGNYYTFTVKDAYGQLVPDVLVSAYRFIPNVNVQGIVAQGVSDFAGTVTLYLQPFVPYTLVVTSSNYATISSLYTPGTNTNPVIQLGATGAQTIVMPNWYYEVNDISWTTTPQNLTVYNATNVTFQISAAHSDLLYFGFNVSRANYSNLTAVCNQQINSSPGGGILNCSITVPGNYLIQPFWRVQNYSERNPVPKTLTYSNGTMFQSAFDTFAASQPIGPWGFYAIALVIAMIAGGWVARYTIDGAGLIVCAVLWFFTLFNPNACLIPLMTGMDYCISPIIITTFTTLATVAALFLVRYL